jgi:hypothetical protein
MDDPGGVVSCAASIRVGGTMSLARCCMLRSRPCERDQRDERRRRQHGDGPADQHALLPEVAPAQFLVERHAGFRLTGRGGFFSGRLIFGDPNLERFGQLVRDDFAFPSRSAAAVAAG